MVILGTSIIHNRNNIIEVENHNFQIFKYLLNNSVKFKIKIII